MTVSPDEIEISFFKSRGPGGQKKNVTESSVRVRHLPTGIVVLSTESRSQHRNKAAALEELEKRLQQRKRRPKSRVSTRPTAASKRRRLDAKKIQATRKKLRQRPGTED